MGHTALQAQVSNEREGAMNALRDLRRQIKFQADARNYDGIDVIRKQLKNDFDSTRVLTLSEEEEVIVGFMIGQYTTVLKAVAAWPGSIYGQNYRLAGPPEDGLYDHLWDVARLDSSNLIRIIEKANVQPREKAFLKLYLRGLLMPEIAGDIERANLTTMSQAYLDQYAPSPYDRFVKVNLRRRYVKNQWGATIGLGAAMGTFQGNFGDLLRFNVSFLLDLEVDYKNMVAGLRLTSGEGTVRRDFEYQGFWDRGLKVNPTFLGLYLGYALDLKPLRITPYYDLGATIITVAERDLNQDNEEFDITSFTHGPGVSLDFLPPLSWEGFHNEVYNIGVRFKGGMLFNNLSNKDPDFESTYPYVGMELIMTFVGTELDLK